MFHVRRSLPFSTWSYSSVSRGWDDDVLGLEQELAHLKSFDIFCKRENGFVVEEGIVFGCTMICVEEDDKNL